jgi:60S ribosome subunit biogenesis protein NIP7
MCIINVIGPSYPYIPFTWCINVTNQDRVYYVSESVMKASTSINKDNLLHCGTCLGKFTKSGKFRLHITALDYLAQYSKVSLSFL